MGASLADRLETIASEKKLTILQVKRLLKDVLTNPAVVNAFRQYMSGQLTLLEPETGAASTSTRRHAQFLGFDLSAFGPRSNIMDILSRRSVTRSLARKLKAEAAQNNSTLPHEKGNHRKSSLEGDFLHQKPNTLLDMDFSDGDDEVECGDMTNLEKVVETTAVEVVPTPIDNGIGRQRDEDYHPTADDISLMQRDLYYDLEDTEAKSVSSSALEEEEEGEADSPTTSLCTVEPFDTPHRDYFLRSRKGDDASMQDCLGGLTPNVLSMLDEDEPNMGAEMDALKFAEAISAPNASVENDPEDQIYTNFLRSLFESSPQETSALSPGVEPQPLDPMLNPDAAHCISETSNAPAGPDYSTANGSRTGADECDDPDFDVMAELESICYDDLFDELRSDRAVRISKMEAKELRRDLVDLLSDDIFFGEHFSTFAKAPTSTKSSAAQHKTSSGKTADVSSYPPLPPPPFDYNTNERLRRQISMHVQLLCSTLTCCIHRMDLEKSVCNVVREAFTDFRGAFRTAKEDPYTYVTGLSDLNDLFSSASAFMTEFAGLTVLPLPPPVPPASASNPPLLPLPFNLLDFVARSSIWAYPHFLPRGLASRPHTLSKRLFSKDEDNLIVLGLANLIEFAPHRFNLFAEGLNRRNRPMVDNSTAAAAKRAMVFDFITKTLIPTKTSLQLHNRKLYMEKMIQRDWLNVRRNAKSSLYLLILDLISGDFEGLQAQRDLLRACVTSFAHRTRAASVSGGLLQRGSVFSRPGCWSLLPPEYVHCCRTLQAQVEAGATGTPQPSVETLLPVFTEGAPQNVEFFLSALLTWWPPSDADEMGKQEEEIAEVNAFPAPPPPVGVPSANMIILLPTLVQPVVPITPTNPSSCHLPLPVTSSISTSPGPLRPPAMPSIPPKHSLPSSLAHPIPRKPPLAPPPKTSRLNQTQDSQTTPPPPSSNGSSTRNQFLPQVSKIIHSFHVVLDRVLRGLTSQTRSRSSTSAALTARFLRRCRRGTPGWLPKVTTAVKEADESDVRRARCLLDRCRLHLGLQTHAEVVRSLTEHQPIIPLERLLYLLSPSRPLWEEFVALCLTPGQARSLHIYPIYAHLQRVGEIHSLLHASLPRAKRLWSRLKKLADARESEELRIPAIEGAPHLSESSRSGGGRKRSKKRRRQQQGLRNGDEDDEGGERQKPSRDVYKSAWSLLETALKDRHALHAQTAISLDPFQRPYSNFSQTFEVVETLARKPLTSLEHAPSLQQVSTPPKPLPRLVDVFAHRSNPTLDGAFVESLQWEVSTELSSSASATAKSKLANRCPCSCHDKRKWSALTPQTPSQSHQSGLLTPSGNKSSAKADSLGLRHCIKCSLRVHQGVVYVDECNFHLAHVQITWPEGFSPPMTSQAACIYPLPPPSSTPPPPPPPPLAIATQLSTQQVLHALEAYQKSNSNGNAPRVPDLARRQVSVDFGELVLPASRKPLDLPDSPAVLSPITEECVKTLASGGMAYSSSSPIYPPSIFQKPPVEVDDEACFNTEAFKQRNSEKEISTATAITTSPTGSAGQSSAWSMAEDRRLLEYFRDVGRCSSRLFRKLAAQWPERSMEEMMARFKYLMLVAYGENYNMDLIGSDEDYEGGDGSGGCESSCEGSGSPIDSDRDMEEEEEED
ncbi:conserved hypothetical protein [Echinococcus multilocularis]|uniref:Myb-like domain-containing protein n=1 Tax=Echinococcus multilocularis TaxID=6211 RepID=A0A068Y6K9_ECHMU|nr:conserved hypothetical protein [Echinococcus multilocularis]